MGKSTPRLVWIDWMKTWAMYFIIAGHCWVPGNKFIYVFSVPCFFILSGFLSKREDDAEIFWKKLLWNLFIPMCLYFTITSVVQFAVQIVKGTFKVSFLYQAPLLAAVGMQGQNYAAGGLKAMWFVYTLLICKILLQYVPTKGHKVSLSLLSCVLLFGAYLLHLKEIVLYNAIVDVLENPLETDPGIPLVIDPPLLFFSSDTQMQAVGIKNRSSLHSA